jgi:predicted enzyme related to lactoylglutathione lyase
MGDGLHWPPRSTARVSSIPSSDRFRFTLVGDARTTESITRDMQLDPSGVRRDSARRKEVTMASDDMSSKTEVAKAAQADMKLEVVVIGVSDVDRAKAFYQSLGWRLDADFSHGDFHAVQMTPHNSDASIIFGKGIASPEPGSARSLVLAVDDVAAARDELVARGADVSEVFHFAAGPFNDAVDNPRVGGPDAEGRSYSSFASFEDPDGNGWLLQEIRTRLPGREWTATRPRATDVATLAELLRDTEAHHGQYEKTHAPHHWWDWYAPYLSARESGSSPEEAATAADRYMDEVHHVPPR